MKVKLTQGRRAKPEDVAKLQQAIGLSISAEYLEFVGENDGAEPESNSFKTGEAHTNGVNQFIPVKEILSEMKYMNHLPPHSFPVAQAEGGNYVFLNQAEGGAVYFWDHELPENSVKIAGSFAQFLDLLEPFDIDSVELKPGQVISVWIDPDFLKSLQ